MRRQVLRSKNSFCFILREGELSVATYIFDLRFVLVGEGEGKLSLVASFRQFLVRILQSKINQDSKANKACLFRDEVFCNLTEGSEWD